MGNRKKSVKDTGKKAAEKVSKWALGKIFKRSFLVIILLASGGLLFNLDRLGNTGINLLKYKAFLPEFVVRFLPGGTAGEGSAIQDDVLEGRVIEVYDGDTLTMLALEKGQEKKYKVRFYGIDAPEAAQEHGRDSREALRKKILGENIRVIVVSVDRYGRSVGRVMHGKRDINLEMIAEGNAWYYRDYAAKEYDFEQAEKEARFKRVGLWLGDDPQPPWLYRKEKRSSGK